MNTLDLYLEASPRTVVKTTEISDVACGMYPCYYWQADSEVWVSTSAADLAAELGSLQRNVDFDIPWYIQNMTQSGATSYPKIQTVIETVADRVRSDAVSYLPSRVTGSLAYLGVVPSSASPWHESWDTIDSRIHRLRPFETATPDSVDREFNPTYSLSDHNELARKTAEHLTRFIHRIEEKFPDYEHIVLTGGKDSQLISLVPKRTDNWHIFSSDPNYPLVKKFVEKNDIEVNNIFRTDNENKERIGDVRRKLVCSDLISDPAHIRWQVELNRIVRDLGGDCILWQGTEADTINTYFPEFHEADDYFEGHLNRAASWQANFHQTTSNFVGSPVLSAYHSQEIWDNVYRHYDPDMMSEGMDIRPQIGRILYEDDVWWPDSNPGPDPYEYDLDVDASELFISGLYDEAGIAELTYPDE